MNTVRTSHLAFGLWVLALLSASAQTTIDTTNKWAWSSGASWINCRTIVTNGGVVSTNGVSVNEFFLSGYMYSATAGWIDVGRGSPTNGTNYSNATSADYGVNLDNKGHLTGYAWNESAGWINFSWTNDPDAVRAPKVNLQNGIFSGYAWGASLGWISLSNSSVARMKTVALAATDANTNGISDAWEVAVLGGTNVLTSTNAFGVTTNDYDGDGIANSNEYVAGTSPMNALDCLELTELSISGSSLTLNWDSKNARIYYIDGKTNLLDPAWTNLEGPLVSDTSSNSTEDITGVGTQSFYRIRVALPFSP